MSAEKQTWTNLSQVLGYSTTAFREWRKLPGAPAVPDPSIWSDFIERNDLGTAGNRVSKGREHWLVEKLKKEVKLQDIRIEKEQRKLVDIDEVAVFVTNLLLGVKQAAYQMARELPRQVIGDELAEAQVKAEKYADQLMLDLQGRVESWWPEDVGMPDAEEEGEA